MYINKSIIDGLKILGFDKETIKKVSREKSLEEIFLSTLFMNYIIVLVVFIITTLSGGITIQNREINQPVFFGLLMVYPFVFNLVVYAIYGFFGFIAELLNNRSHIKPLVSVGFHTAIVYTILVYIIGLLSTFDLAYGLFLLGIFFIYFLFTMFLSIKVIYQFSTPQTLIIILLPIMFAFIILLAILSVVELRTVIAFFLA